MDIGTLTAMYQLVGKSRQVPPQCQQINDNGVVIATVSMRGICLGYAGSNQLRRWEAAALGTLACGRLFFSSKSATFDVTPARGQRTQRCSLPSTRPVFAGSFEPRPQRSIDRRILDLDSLCSRTRIDYY
jgi:hypothetical protein